MSYRSTGQGQTRERSHTPVPTSRNYVGPAAQMFGTMLANRAGIGSIPLARDYSGRGFQMLGQNLQGVPFARGIGTLLNQVARPVNYGMGLMQNMNPVQNMMGRGISGLFGGLFGRLFGRRRQGQQTGQGIGGAPYNEGLIHQSGRLITPFQAPMDDQPDQPDQDEGRGFFDLTLTPFERAERLRTEGPIGPGMDMDAYGFGQGIRRPDARGIVESVNRQIMANLPFQQIDDPTGKFYTLIDKRTGKTIVSGRHHKDYRPSYTKRTGRPGHGGGL